MRARCIRLFLLASIFIGGTSVFAEPLELGILREKREAEVEKIDKQYTAALKKLMVKYTKAGRLEDAVAVRDEIDIRQSSQPTKIAENKTITEKKKTATKNQLIGKWKYSANGYSHIREFTATTCTLFGSAGEISWTREYELESPTVAILEGGSRHELLKDGTLSIGGRYAAVRVVTPAEPATVGTADQ